jgi:hypothetical protein
MSLFFWLANIKIESRSWFGSGFNMIIPLIFGFMSLWTTYFLNDPKYFNNLYLVTSNSSAIEVLIGTYLTLSVVTLFSFFKAAEDFVLVNKFPGFLTLLSSLLFLFILKKDFPDLQRYFDLLVLAFSCLFFVKKSSFALVVMILGAAAVLVNGTSGHVAVMVVPFFTPAIVSRIALFLKGHMELFAVPLLVVPLGIMVTLNSSQPIVGKLTLILLILGMLKIKKDSRKGERCP